MLLYIDPGTGSMLFTLIIGLVTTGYFLAQKGLVRLRFLLSGGNAKVAQSEEKIPLLLFSEGRQYWNTFEPICDELERRGVDTVFWTMGENDPALQKEYTHITREYIGEGNRAFARLNTANADVLLATTPGLDVFQWKRSKNVRYYIHIMHSVNDSTSYRMFGLDFFDAVLMSGDYQVEQQRQLEAMRGLPAKEMPVVGCTYIDGLKKRLENEGDKPAGEASETTVLLAPSWGASSILVRYGESILEALLATGYRIVVRPHPQSFVSDKAVIDRLMEKYPAGEKISWNRDADNFECLQAADVMISDFSGVVYDYALVFNRPLIYADTQFDKAPYDAAWFEEDQWKFRNLPKLGIPLKQEDFPRLREIIEELINSDVYEKGREEVRDFVWMHRGEAASRTVDYLMQCMEAKK